MSSATAWSFCKGSSQISPIMFYLKTYFGEGGIANYLHDFTSYTNLLGRRNHTKRLTNFESVQALRLKDSVHTVFILLSVLFLASTTLFVVEKIWSHYMCHKCFLMRAKYTFVFSLNINIYDVYGYFANVKYSRICNHKISIETVKKLTLLLKSQLILLTKIIFNKFGRYTKVNKPSVLNKRI